MAENQNNFKVATAIAGLNKDSVPSQLQESQYTYALNANIENFDGNSLTIGNDQANVECVTFPSGYKIIGVKNIQELNRVVFFLTNPTTGFSQIGYVENGVCEYTVLIDDQYYLTDEGSLGQQTCQLGFSIDYPIHKVEVKTTNCSTQIYWTDGLNPRRYLDFDDLPWKEVVDQSNAYKKIKLDGQLDCNKLNVQPDFSIPYIEPVEVAIGGSLVSGTYQFAVQYSNAQGEGYTSYYNVSNPISIFENELTGDFDTVTSKSIEINVLDIDITGLYEWFNIAVVKTINNISTAQLVGTFPTSAAVLNSSSRTSFKYVYTGAEVSTPLDIADVLIQYPYYDIAGDVTQVDNVLVWSNLQADETINYQPIWSSVKLQWETHQVPYNEFEAYNNGINSAILRGYMRDEVYAFEGCFILKNGKQTKSFHIPGRAPNSTDLEWIGTDNKDNLSPATSECKDPEARRRWQVYNTGYVIDKHPDYKEFVKTKTTTSPNFGDTFTGNIAITCNSGDCSQGSTSLVVTFNQATTKPIQILLGFETNTQSMGSDLGYTPSKPVSSFYGTDPFRLNIPAGTTSITFPATSISNNRNTWVCLPNCSPCSPATWIETLYIKIPCNTANFSVTSNNCRGVAAINIPDTCGDTTTTETNANCYKGKFEYGEFAYWESEELYPNNTSIWGLLANKPIRHHKFPDFLVSPIHSQNDKSGQDYKSNEYAIYPIGVSIDINSLKDAIQNSPLSQEEKDQIVGFKIFRGNRATNKSVIAKGILHNVGKSTYDGKDYYYPNYPYNDLRKDVYYNTSQFYRSSIIGADGDFLRTALKSSALSPNQHIPLGYDPTFNTRFLLDGFTEPAERFVFHSPDTHFFQPSLSDAGNFLKLDAAIYGKSYGHFVSVENNAEYKFLTRDTIIAAAGMAIASGINVAGGSAGAANVNIPVPTFSLSSAPAVYTAMNEIFEKIAPFTNFGYFHTSIGHYGNYYAIPNEISSTIHQKQRNIDFIRYTSDGGNGIEDGNLLNNFRRESSVYLHTSDTLYYPTQYSTVVPEDNSRYTLASLGDNLAPEIERETNISSYYGAIKRYLPRQWGRLYSYETIDTGYYLPLNQTYEQRNVPTVFGGDIYINRFAYKSKLPLFRRNTVGAQNSTDINYNEIGNLNYPVFWISTKPLDEETVDISAEVDKVIKGFSPDASQRFWNVVAAAFTLGGSAVQPSIKLLYKLFKEIYDKIGIKNINLDRWNIDNSIQQETKGITEQGLIYLFVYGVPYYFCESEVNVDYRQSYNELEGNFFPNVTNDIPDDWLQEKNVPIINDNTYTYNKTYSKQNKESFVDHLGEDFDPEELCTTNFPNRAIWSDKSSLEENKNNWLIYRPSAYYDFPKSYGALVSLDKIQNIEVLARFENKSQRYNALTVANVSDGPQAYLGNPALFSGTPPIDIAETDNGYAGSQNKFLLRTEFGQVFVDAKRGQVILLSSNGTQTISNLGMSKWFAENLPFQILKTFPDFPIDNAQNAVGITGTYDQFYQRLIITKKDYVPKEGVDVFSASEVYYNDQVAQQSIKINFGDPEYFVDKSWTLSFSFKTNSWTSFHSFAPNYYVAYPTYFQTGINNNALFVVGNDATTSGSSLWNHNRVYNEYQTYYNTEHPFILEYPFPYTSQDQILQSVKTYCNSRVYSSQDTFYEPNEILFFNKVIAYNYQQCSGIRNLVPKPKNNLSSYMQYPKYNSDSIDILVSKADNFFNFNGLWDVSINKSEPLFTTPETFLTTDKDINQDNMKYTNTVSYNKAPLRARDAFIRLILDNRSDFKLLTKFAITRTTPSYL